MKYLRFGTNLIVAKNAIVSIKIQRVNDFTAGLGSIIWTVPVAPMFVNSAVVTLNNGEQFVFNENHPTFEELKSFMRSKNIIDDFSDYIYKE